MTPIYWLCRGLSKLIAIILFQYRCYGAEKIPKTGPVLLAMNHQSFVDPPLCGIATNRQVNFLARKTLMDNPVLKWLLPRLEIVPVDQDRPDMGALKAVIRILKNGGVTAIFPEGSRSWDGALQPALPGIGLVVAKTMAPVVPMRIFGAYKALPRGSKKVKYHPITVVVGEPIYFTEADIKGAASKEALYQQIASRVMAEIGQLSLPPERASSE